MAKSAIYITFVLYITATSAVWPCDRQHFRIVIDPGHSPSAPGAISARGRTEHSFNLTLSSLIAWGLVEAGFRDTRILDSDSLSAKVSQANELSPNLFLSVHHDSTQKLYLQSWHFDGKDHLFSDRFHGWSLFISSSNKYASESLGIAKSIGRNLIAAGLPFSMHHAEKIPGEGRSWASKEYGVYRYDNLFVLKHSSAPAVLMEAGLIVNRAEELELASADRQHTTSQAFINAVEEFCSTH